MYLLITINIQSLTVQLSTPPPNLLNHENKLELAFKIGRKIDYLCVLETRVD